MKTFSGSSFVILIIVSLFQTGFVRVVFIYAKDLNSMESVEINWERNKEATSLPTIKTTESPITPKPPIEALTCPDDSTISPCSCSLDRFNGRVDIECHGTVVNQTTIENVFREIRRVNEIPQDGGIGIYRFDLYNSKLTEVDMSPFYGNQMDELRISYNSALTKLVTSGNPQDHGSIHANLFYLGDSPINREGFGDILKYFSNEMTTFEARGLSLYEENISGEFLPGLSAHTNLKDLYLRPCNISGRLDSDTWIPKELQNLEFIDLDDNTINEIGENVFDFYPGGISLLIDLQYNKLNESSFHPNSGISRAGRQTILELEYNQIKTLPASIFEPFLDAHPQNFLDLWGNPLICDERLSWIKSRREEFQKQVRDAKCSNDPGHDVFDSNLIPDLKNNN